LTYPGAMTPSLRDISLRLAPDEKVALIGRNGAGKTTLIKLLLRLYEPTAGQILLDGIDLREYDVDDLRAQMSVLFQDFSRYEFTAHDNIAFGDVTRLDDRARVMTAAAQSLAAPVIERLERGYDHTLGRRFESGADLSGGEWQRIALARAYMKEPRVFILDEPSAGLDPRTERKVLSQFFERADDRLVIVTSHRLSTIRMANRIVVLNQGSVQEDGTHEQLVSRGGRYAAMYDVQAALR
jgi:ATP-binding cassette subfamily B protein